jgi:dipeptidyl aminopeptidase/acylaminoacyl peptidase
MFQLKKFKEKGMFLIEKNNKDFYDMEKAFHKYNKLLFNNELVLDFPLRWGSLKHSMGVVKYVSDGRTKEPLRVISLTLSNVYEFTPEDFRDTMIHEMIHVYTTQKHIYEKPHGREFISWMNKINKMGDYKITPTEEGEVQVNSDRAVKPIYVVELQKKDGNNSFAFIKSYLKGEVLISKGRSSYINYFLITGKGAVCVYKVVDPNAVKMKISRSLETATLYILRDKAQIDLIKNSPKVDYVFFDEKGRLQDLLK